MIVANEIYIVKVTFCEIDGKWRKEKVFFNEWSQKPF